MRQTINLLFILSLTAFGCSSSDKPTSEETEPASLETTPNATITETYWKLTALEGQPVKMAENQEREIHFILKSEDMRVTGFSGCNHINGSYELEEGNRIRFTQMAATLMACPDVEVDESAVLEVFNLTDNYTINGDTLSLNVGRRAPLAIFEAVYLQ